MVGEMQGPVYKLLQIIEAYRRILQLLIRIKNVTVIIMIIFIPFDYTLVQDTPCRDIKKEVIASV